MDILIKNGVISDIGKKLALPANCKEIKLKNLHVSNGWFDTSVSLGEPGFEERENIQHGLEVAAVRFTKSLWEIQTPIHVSTISRPLNF